MRTRIKKRRHSTFPEEPPVSQCADSWESFLKGPAASYKTWGSSSKYPYPHFQCHPVLILAKIVVPYKIENRYSRVYGVVRISSPHSAKLLIMRCCRAGSQIAIPSYKFIHANEGGHDYGLPEVQRIDAVGTILGLFPGLLCMEMHQLRSGHRSDDRQQSEKQPCRQSHEGS